MKSGRERWHLQKKNPKTRTRTTTKKASSKKRELFRGGSDGSSRGERKAMEGLNNEKRKVTSMFLHFQFRYEGRKYVLVRKRHHGWYDRRNYQKTEKTLSSSSAGLLGILFIFLLVLFIFLFITICCSSSGRSAFRFRSRSVRIWFFAKEKEASMGHVKKEFQE